MRPSYEVRALTRVIVITRILISEQSACICHLDIDLISDLRL